MPNCPRCLEKCQGQQCLRCGKGIKECSPAHFGETGVEEMAEGGDGGFHFPEGLDIPGQDTPEYISFLEDKLKSQWGTGNREPSTT